MTLFFAFHSFRFFIKYVVVKFLISDSEHEETIGIIPSSWINYSLNTCKWPPKKYPSDKISRWVMSLTEPKDDFEDIQIQIMHEYDTYAKARKASIKAEEESAIDTAAGESDIGKCRQKHKPARYKDSDSSEIDNPPPKKLKETKCFVINDSSDEENSTIHNIQTKVKKLLEDKTRSPSFLSRTKKPRIIKHTVLSPSLSYTEERKISQPSVLQDYTCLEVKKNKQSVVKSLFNDAARKMHISELSPNRNKSPPNKITSPLIKDTSFEVLDKVSPTVKTSTTKAATSQSLYNSPTYLDVSPLQKKLPIHGTSSSSFEKIMSPSKPSTTKDTSISFKSVTSQPSHKSSLPSLMKNIHTQLDPHVAAVLQILVDRQEEIHGKIEHVILMLHRIHRKLAPEEEKTIKPKGLPPLPLNNEDAFFEFQNFLTPDDNFYPVVDYFTTLMKVDEQTDEYTAVGHILPKLITNSLARMINYAGSGLVKLKFQNTKLHEAINCAVLKVFPTSNLIQAERKMLRWFHTSNQRKI